MRMLAPVPQKEAKGKLKFADLRYRGKASQTFNIAMDNIDLVQMLDSFEHLLHKALDVVWLQGDIGVPKQTSQIIVHVGKDHVANASLASS